MYIASLSIIASDDMTQKRFITRVYYAEKPGQLDNHKAPTGGLMIKDAHGRVMEIKTAIVKMVVKTYRDKEV
jgi:hypothetical protein